MKNIIIVIIIVVIPFILLNCSSQKSSEIQKENKEITVDLKTEDPTSANTAEGVTRNRRSGDSFSFALPLEPVSLNPMLVNDITSYSVIYLLFESLLTVDPQLNFVPRLATQWDISEDFNKITFSLRQDVYWHDGTRFTADDVLFTYQLAASPKASFRFKSALADIEKVEVPGPDQFVVYYKHPMASALNFWATFCIMPRHIFDNIEDAFDLEESELIGTGPYAFSEWNTSKYIKLTAFPKYWYSEPQIKNILFRIIPSENIAFKSLLKGNIDGLEVTPSLWAQNSGTQEVLEKLNSYKCPTLNFFVVAWNANKTNHFFNDPNVRKAMTLGIDRRSIIQKLLFGLAEPCSGPFSPHSWGYNHLIQPLPFDLKKAGDLLDQAGWIDSDQDGIRDKNGVPFKFKLNIPANNRLAEKVASMIQYNLELVGIMTDIIRLEYATYLERLITRQYQACLMALALTVDPDVYPFLHSSQTIDGYNFTAYSNPEVDQLLEEGQKTFVRMKRTQKYHKVHEIVHREQPYTFLFSKPQLFFMSKDIEEVQATPAGLFLYFPGLLNWTITP